MTQTLEPKENSEFTKMNRKKIAIIVASVVGALVVVGGVVSYFVFFADEGTSELTNTETSEEFGDSDAEGDSKEPVVSPLSGVETTKEKAERRPIAVMLGSDAVARPLSGLSTAEMVFEMPVTTNHIPRIMGVWQVNDPKEVGGIRSARHDFIPVAKGLGAVFVHWGGSFRALSWLSAGYIEDIDALTNGDTFYRVSRKAAPYNGYSDFGKIREKMDQRGFKNEATFEGYEFVEDIEEAERPTKGTLKIPYPGAYQVTYKYNQKENKYIRYHNNDLQKDEIDDAELTAKNVIVMFAKVGPLLNTSYTEIDVEGEGDCALYQNGTSMPCTWEKDPADMKSKLKFLDKEGKEIPLVKGSTWVSVVPPDYTVSYTGEE